MDRKLPRWIESYKDGQKVTKKDIKLPRGQKDKMDRKLPRKIESY